MAEIEKSLMEHITFESSGTYEFLEEIGRGGMGIVYLCERNTEGVVDYVVLKTIKTVSDSFEQQLKREANVATRLRHENIVKTYGLESISLTALPERIQAALNNLGTPSGGATKPAEKVQKRTKHSKKMDKEDSKLKIRRAVSNEKKLFLIVMDYIEGTDLKNLFLAHLFDDLLMPPYLSAFIICRICRALSYAHNYIIHRDVSPENILIDNQGVCKLTDFGVAVEPTAEIKVFAGKFSYMAPEQFFGKPIDQRADIFALGLVSYQILTGILLYPSPPGMTAQQQYEHIKKLMDKDIVSPSEICRDIPKELSDIVMKMLEKDPDNRYLRISEAAAELEKNFLYAKGYGPTNVALASYIDIFASKFREYTEEHLGQLSFLRDSSGRMKLKRRIRPELYTEAGWRVIAERPDLLLFKKLSVMKKVTTSTPTVSSSEDFSAEEEKRDATVMNQPHRNLIKLAIRENVTETFELHNGATVGRSSGNSFIIIDAGISRQHTKFTIIPKGVMVEDTGSNNGTFVNGTRIEGPQQIHEGDVIRFGKRAEVTFLREFLSEESGKCHDLETNALANFKAQFPEAKAFYFKVPPKEALFAEIADYIEQLITETEFAEYIRFQLLGGFTEILNFISREQSKKELFVKFSFDSKQIKIVIQDQGGGEGFQKLLDGIRNFKNPEGEQAGVEYLIAKGQLKMILKCPGKLEFDHGRKEIHIIKLC
ncbi:MAG: FHA domain-containing serine/threonine-protein kinase [Planctomycetota bacterium]